MTHADVIIIGAGAAGLMAARDISASGKSVVILEASNRSGGRIFTVYDADFPEPLQLGAEFIHGDLPLTTALLNEAGLKYHPVKGDFYRFNNGRLETEKEAFAGWDRMMKKLEALKNDMSLEQFLDTYFGGPKNEDLRRSVTNYTAGYDAADAEDASVLGLYEEWKNEEDCQYYISGGYAKLLDHLEQTCTDRGCRIMFSDPVKSVSWERGRTEVLTARGNIYTSSKLLITVPVGILQAKPGSSNYIVFKPEVTEIREKADHIGFGSVLKVVIRFTYAFWKTGKQMINMGFVLSDEKIPTWWTHPEDLPVLTGWAGGTKAQKFKGKNESTIRAAALESLSAIFSTDPIELEKRIRAFHYCNWADEPFAAGAYSYPIAGHANTKVELTVPVEHTIYVAGEACRTGKASGTVEAALVSGRNAAEMIMHSEAG